MREHILALVKSSLVLYLLEGALRFLGLVTATTVAVLPMLASAATINVSVFDAAAYNPTFGIGTVVTEDFETLGTTLGEGEVGASLASNVGSFSSLGGTGTGGTVTGLTGNTGTELALRDDSVFGRTNTTPNAGDWFLDSNDTYGIRWDVSLGGATTFDYLTFSLMDANDVGGFLRITTGTDSYELRIRGTDGKLTNGNIKLVTIDLGADVTSATIELENFQFDDSKNRKNDGFSIDGVQVYTDFFITEVPVPASMLLLGSAIAGFGFAGRRKKTAK